MERRLASIRRVKEISPIEGADNIEKITIDGWHCIAKKHDFNVGDLCVYFEIDSFLPIKPEFEFLRKSSYRKMGDQEGFRLKTIRLRGTLSQGLVLPISIISPTMIVISEYMDVTDSLGVIKWEPPIPAQLQGVCKGNFPSFIRRTDQERVQNVWQYVKDCEDSFEVTIKMDGSSCTYYLYNDNFGVCSRNMELEESESNTFWKVARENNVEALLRAYGKNIALQGELVGEGIQKNPHKIKGQDFYLFDIWDIDKQEYMTQEKRLKTFVNFLTLKHVHHVHFAIGLNAYDSIQEILEFADGFFFNDSPVEGLVFKSNQDTRKSFKVISNNYLLRAEKDE